MSNLRRKFAVGTLMAVCLNMMIFASGAAYAGAFDISDESSMDAALGQASKSADQNPESIRQREEFASERAKVDAQADKEASRGSLLPNSGSNYQTVDACKDLINELSTMTSSERKALFQEDGVISTQLFTQNDILGCGIRTGSIGLWMVPYYVRYVLEFAIQMAGLVAVAGIVYGGYLYLFAGVSDEKDKGKKAIMYSLAGMILTMIAWAVVNIVIGFLTG